MMPFWASCFTKNAPFGKPNLSHQKLKQRQEISQSRSYQKGYFSNEISIFRGKLYEEMNKMPSAYGCMLNKKFLFFEVFTDKEADAGQRFSILEMNKFYFWR